MELNKNLCIDIFYFISLHYNIWYINTQKMQKQNANLENYETIKD